MGLSGLIDLYPLIRTTAGRSKEAQQRFRAIFDRNYRFVLAYALRRADNRATADDVVSETFLVAWRRLDEVPEGAEALPWLLGVARRVLSNARRGDLRRDRLISKLRHQGHEAIATSDEPLNAALRRQTIVAALGRVRPSDAEVLKLVFWEHLTHAQIAVVLECSVNAVGIRVHRARRNLLKEMQKGSSDSGHSLVTELAPLNPQ